MYEVSGPCYDQCIVDYHNRYCYCRRWELDGIPCKQGVAVMWNMESNGIEVGPPENLVHISCWLETLKNMYIFKLKPIN